MANKYQNKQSRSRSSILLEREEKRVRSVHPIFSSYSQERIDYFLYGTLRASFSLYYCLFALFLSIFEYSPLFAQTPPLKLASSARARTTLETAPNGIPIVNIAKPNHAGVSHNLFQDFNVGKRGLVLNNSTVLGQSQLAGALVGNPHIAGGQPARLILNEVRGGRPSELKGYTEIFGKRAQYVLANPYGITCDGCGFINTPRATLSTGIPQFQDGSLHRLEVEQGNITIASQGLHSTDFGEHNTKVDYFDLVTRSVNIQGPVHAATIRVYAGQHDFHYANQHIVQRISGRDGESPAWALDAAALGAMYADTIFIQLTEAGAGARIKGNLAATGDEVSITADGRLEIRGQISAQKNIELTSESNININSSVYARQSANITKAAQLTVGTNGRLFGGSEVSIRAQQMRVDGQIAAGVNDAGRLSRQGRFLAHLNQGLRNLGIIAAGLEVEMTVTHFINNQGTLYSAGSMNLYFNQLVNDEGAEILSNTNIQMARNKSQGRASSIVNQSALIESRNGDISLYSNSIENNKKNFSMTVWRPNYSLTLPSFECQETNCFGNSKRGTARALRERAYVRGNINAPIAQIVSGASINLYAATVKNNYSQIRAVDDIYIETGSFTNRAGKNHEIYNARNWSADLDYRVRVREICVERRFFFCHDRDVIYRSGWASALYAERRQLGPDAPASIEAGGDINISATGDVNNDNDGGTRQEGEELTLNFVDFGGLSLVRESSGLFIINERSHSPYLIESNPLFTDLEQYIGSDYFFERSGLRLEDFEYYQRLGDPFYETRMVQKQIFKQRGTRYLEDDIFDDAEQMRRLFDNAAKEHKALALVPGIKLSALQIKHLQSDIIWMVEKKLKGRRVLAPRLYLAKVTDQNSTFRGGVLRARHINIKAASIRNESGGIIAKEKLKILTQSGDIKNVLGLIKGGNVVLDSRKNVLNEGGSILGKRLLVHARENVINQILTERFQADGNNYTDHVIAKAWMGTKVKPEEKAALQIIAGGSILSEGASIDSQGETQLKAGGDIILSAAALDEKSERYYSGGFEKNFKRRNLASSLHSDGSLQISAGGDLRLLASSIRVDGQANIDVGGSVDVMHLLDKEFYNKKTTSVKKSALSKKTTVELWGYDNETLLSSEISAGLGLRINAGGGVLLTGSRLKAGNGLWVNSGFLKENEVDGLVGEKPLSSDSIVVKHATAKKASWHHKKTRHSVLGLENQKFASALSFGFGSYGLSSGLTPFLKGAMPAINERLKNILKAPDEYRSKTQDIIQNSSHLNAGQELSLNSDGDILIQASHLISGNSMEINALGSLSVLSAFNEKRRVEEKRKTSFARLKLETDLWQDDFKHTSSASFKTEESFVWTNSLRQVSSRLFSGGDLKIKAKGDITIIANNGENKSQERSQKESYGVTAYGDLGLESTEGSLAILSQNDLETYLATESELTSSMNFSMGNAILEAGRESYRRTQELLGRKKSPRGEAQIKGQNMESGEEKAKARVKKSHKNLLKLSKGLHFLNALNSLSASIKRAIASSGSYGFYFETDLDTNAITTKTKRKSERALASLLRSIRGNVNLSAKKELLILGSDIISDEGSINLYGGEKVVMEAALQDQSISKETIAWNRSVSGDTTGRISAGYSESKENLESKGSFYRHSALLALKGALNIRSAKDAWIQGALGEAQDLRVKIAGDLKMETLQDLSDTKLKGSFYSMGVNSAGGFNLGIGNTQSVERYKWASRQTALIGTELVDIQADKISLIGAKIANEYRKDEAERIDKGKLSIRANEIFYQDIEDSNRAELQKIGATLSYSKQDSLKLQFVSQGHDKRGITRATLGKGSIFALNNPLGIAGINRDITRARYLIKNEVKEVVELSTDMLTDPRSYIEDLARLPEDIEELGKEISKDVKELTEKAENYIQTDHFATDRRLLPILYGMINEDRKLTEGQSRKLEEVVRELKKLSSPKRYRQSQKNKTLLATLGGIFHKARNFKLDASLEEEQMSLISDWHKTKDLKERRRIRRKVKAIENHKGYFHSVQDYLSLSEGRRTVDFARSAIKELCNVIAYNLHGRATGTDERSLGDFIEEELQKGNIGWSPGKAKISLAYSTGSELWRKSRGMDRIRRKNYYTSKAKIHGPKLTYGEYIRRKLNESGTHVAVSWQDTKKNGLPNHFFLIFRDEKGVWRNLDHTSKSRKRRGDEVLWEKVHGVDFLRGEN